MMANTLYIPCSVEESFSTACSERDRALYDCMVLRGQLAQAEVDRAADRAAARSESRRLWVAVVLLGASALVLLAARFI